MLAASLSACAAGGGYWGEVLHPAELPVRSFAPILVAHAGDADSREVGAALVEALVRGGTAAELRAASEATSPGMALRVELAVMFRQRVETRWSTRPENVCGPYGCYVRQVSYPYDAVTLVGEVGVSIRDVVADRLLAERRIARQELGGDSSARRAHVRNLLAVALLGLVDPRVERVRVRFARVRVPEAELAREAARAGDWDAAEAHLVTLRDGPAFAALDPEDRARVLHDMALAIRFGRTARAEPSEALGRALVVIEQARALHDAEAHRVLEAALRAQLEEARVLERQRAAVGVPAASIPVPEGYGLPSP